MYLLDVAAGPLYIIFGLGILLILAIVVLIVFFAVRVLLKIRKNEQIIKQNRENEKSQDIGETV